MRQGCIHIAEPTFSKANQAVPLALRVRGILGRGKPC